MIGELKKNHHSVQLSCHLFEVNESSFYAWLRREPSTVAARNEALKKEIESLFKKNKSKYGSPRIYNALKSKGIIVGENKVADLMREMGLSAIKKKAFKPKTTINKPDERKSARVFKIEDYKVKKENEVWGSDLTYIQMDKGFCYLVVVLDLFNREIKGWDVSGSMEASQTQKALLNAIQATDGSLKETIFHSDQGSQYCSDKVRGTIQIVGMKQSMSRKGNCYDNAFVESFFHSLKNELEKSVFKNLEEAKKYVFEYMNWYNRERLHSSLGYMSPIEYKENINRQCA